MTLAFTFPCDAVFGQIGQSLSLGVSMTELDSYRLTSYFIALKPEYMISNLDLLFHYEIMPVLLQPKP